MNAAPRAAGTIRRLRLVERQRGLGRALLHDLAATELPPSALPAAAILLVRRLAGRVQDGAALSDGWQAALATTLARCQAAAARPALGFVPAASAAVWFADEAELLACLCRDWLAGNGSQWWWRALYPQGVNAGALGDALLAQPGRLPVVLARLQAIGLAAPLLAALPLATVAAMLHALPRQYALLAWQRRCEPLLARLGDGGVTSRAPRPAPWLAMPGAPSVAGLGPERQALLGLALTLAQQPQAARQTAFALAAERWLRDCLAAAGAGSEESQPQPVVAPPAPAVAPTVSVEVDADRQPLDTAVSHPAPVPPLAARQAIEIFAADDTTIPTAVQQAVPAAPMALPLAIAGTMPGVAAAAALPALPPAEPARIRTRYGGVFYLINLALVLGLYGDFSQPRRPGWALPPWDFLALLGERLVGPAFRDDALWPLLACLAGRAAGAEPGDGHAPPAGWRLPPDWQAGRAMPAQLGPWLGWLVAAITPRLALQLGCAPDDIGPRLCRHDAELSVGDDTLDIHLGLDTLPIEIRVAGLDRDPGWVPAAARTIRFHFEP